LFHFFLCQSTDEKIIISYRFFTLGEANAVIRIDINGVTLVEERWTTLNIG